METYFFFGDRWNEEYGMPPEFGWGIARLRDGLDPIHPQAYKVEGPFPNYAETLSAWRAGLNA